MDGTFGAVRRQAQPIAVLRRPSCLRAEPALRAPVPGAGANSGSRPERAMSGERVTALSCDYSQR